MTAERLDKIIEYCDSPERQGYPVPLSEFKALMLELRAARARLALAVAEREGAAKRIEKLEAQNKAWAKAAAMFGALWEKSLPPDRERPAVCAELDVIRASLAAGEARE